MQVEDWPLARYCDTIRARWEKFTGNKAVLQPREVAA
jgi:hypothetical protein